MSAETQEAVNVPFVGQLKPFVPPHAMLVTLVTGKAVQLNPITFWTINDKFLTIEHGEGNKTIIPMTSIIAVQVQQTAPSPIVAPGKITPAK